VTIQAQILNLMRQLKEKLGTAIIMITHDLGVIAEMADRVLVMYAGLKAEEAPARELFDRPMHPYTRGLMASIPSVNATAEAENGPRRLQEIPGVVPSLRGGDSGLRLYAALRAGDGTLQPRGTASCGEGFRPLGCLLGNGHMRSTTHA
jgi:peptide/nickel transport system ATP-binding protein